MNEFIRRLSMTGLKIIKFTVEFIVTVVSLFLLFGFLLVLMIALPVWLLTFIIGDYAILWAFIILISVPVIAEWDKISSWLYWQFIEPFKK